MAIYQPTTPATTPPTTGGINAVIAAARTALPSHTLTGVPLRRFVSAVCTAEVEHARNDFWHIAHRIGAAARFDRFRDPDCDAQFRLSHEVRAAAALNWLAHLQTHDSDRRGALGALGDHALRGALRLGTPPPLPARRADPGLPGVHRGSRRLRGRRSMSDVINLSEGRKAHGKAAKLLRDATTGADLGSIADKTEGARATAEHINSDIKLVAGILEVFALGCGEPHRTVTDQELDRQWLQVEYLARQMQRHADELAEALEVTEYGVMAVNRVAKSADPTSPDDGGAA